MADDGELWKRICQGDADAFDGFYRAYGTRLELFLRRVLPTRQAAEDVMQETFARIWQNPNGYEATRGTLGAYLFGAGKKRAAEWWQRHSRGDRVRDVEITECKTETILLVGNALSQLPEEQRSLLWLKIVEGYSYADLAKILDIPIGTVRSRLFAAREELRKVWQRVPQEK